MRRDIPKLWSGEAVGADTFKDLVLTGALGMSLIYFALVGFVVAFPHGVLSRLLSTPLLIYLGGISYALYMCHVPVEGLLVMLRGRPLAADSLLVVGIYWIVVLALATFSRIFIEDRFNALKERYPVFTKAT